VVKDLDSGSEALGALDGIVCLEDHNITNTRHVVLGKTLDVHADVITLKGFWHVLVVHFDGEDLASAGSGCTVSGQEEAFVTGLDGALFNTASEHITDTLDFVDTREWHAHLSGRVAGWWLDELFEAVKEGFHGDLIATALETAADDLNTLPPRHVGGFGDEVVTLPSGDWKDWEASIDKGLLPSNFLKHVAHFVTDFVVALFLVGGDIAVHLVDANNELFDTEKVDEHRVLTGLALDLTSLGVTLGNGSGEVTVGWNHKECTVGLGSTSDHVLDKVSVPWGIDDSVVVRFGEEFLGGAGDGYTTFALFLLAVHIESEGERAFADLVSFSLELLDFTLGDTAEFEDKTSGGGGLAGIDVSADDN